MSSVIFDFVTDMDIVRIVVDFSSSV